ncbi:MAG TPA: glycosyltransferase family 39 protein, partial [Thermoanaerobaculia bacterium]
MPQALRRSLRRLAAPAAAVALLAVLVAQAATSIRHKSITHDESSHFTYGRQVLEQRTFLRHVHRHNATSPWMAIEAAAAATASADGDDRLGGERLRRARLATLLFGVGLGLVVFAWARRSHGDAAGLMALALAAFSPNLLAHARLVTTDVLAAFGIVLALWTFWRLHRRRSATRLAIAGLALGFALTTKATAFDLVPVLALLAGWRSAELWRARRGSGRAVAGGPAWEPWLDLALVGLVALVAVNAVHGFEGTFSTLAEQPARSRRFQALAAVPGIASVPLPLPAGWVQGLDWLSQDLERGRWTYLLGAYSRDGFPHYYLVAFLVKSTPALLALTSLAAALALARRLPPPAGGAPTARYLLLPAAALFVHLSLFHSFQIGIRHLLPVYPLLWIAVAAVAAADRRSLRLAGWVLVALHATSSLAAHPHYLAYFNELAGGPAAGHRYLVDSNIDGGQDRAQARRVWARFSLVPVIEDPGGPTAGRILINVNRLVGLSPAEHRTYAWLRDHFTPVDSIGHSWLVYDVDADALR